MNTTKRWEQDPRIKSVRQGKLGLSSRAERISLASADLLALFLAFFFAGWATAGIQHSDRVTRQLEIFGSSGELSRLALFSVVALGTVFLFWIKGHYAQRRPFGAEMRSMVRGLAILGCADAAFMYFSEANVSRSWLLATWLLALITVPAARFIIKRLMLWRGYWSRPVVVIGTGENARRAIVAMETEPLLGFEVVAMAEPPESWHIAVVESTSDASDLAGAENIPVIQLSDQPSDDLMRIGNPHIVVALDSADRWEVSRLLHESGVERQSLDIIPPITGLPLIGMQLFQFNRPEIMMLRVRNNLARVMPQRLKRFFDLAVSGALLIVLSPVMLFLIIALRRDGGGAFYGHRRIGWHGEMFTCHKFRTMVPDADKVLEELLRTDAQARDDWNEDFKLKDDPRITRIGSFLRRYSLDELPQLWNVLVGEMSLVGPRPIVEEELDRYGIDVSYYLMAKPGITGLWQISGRNDVDYTERVAMDVWYAKNWSLWYDLLILVSTVKVVIEKRGAY
jgi:undecaprenyl-phosphate galactose phosphotransferase